MIFFKGFHLPNGLVLAIKVIFAFPAVVRVRLLLVVGSCCYQPEAEAATKWIIRAYYAHLISYTGQ